MSPNPNNWPSWVPVSKMKHEKLTSYCYYVCWLQFFVLNRNTYTPTSSDYRLLSNPIYCWYPHFTFCKSKVGKRYQTLCQDAEYFLQCGNYIFYLYYHVIKIYSSGCNTFLIMGISEDWLIIISLRQAISGGGGVIMD